MLISFYHTDTLDKYELKIGLRIYFLFLSMKYLDKTKNLSLQKIWDLEIPNDPKHMKLNLIQPIEITKSTWIFKI